MRVLSFSDGFLQDKKGSRVDSMKVKDKGEDSVDNLIFYTGDDSGNKKDYGERKEDLDLRRKSLRYDKWL